MLMHTSSSLSVRCQWLRENLLFSAIAQFVVDIDQEARREWDSPYVHFTVQALTIYRIRAR